MGSALQQPVCMNKQRSLAAPVAASLRHGKACMGRTAALLRCPHRRWTGRAAAGAQRGHLDVQCNELNKWADRDGQDDDCNFEEGQWDVDLARLVVRVLTAKAAQRLQAQLQELDLHKAHWFNNYMSAHSPSGGNEFLLALFKEPAVVVQDVTNNTQHTIDPPNLAHRIIQIRADLSLTLPRMPGFVELENTAVLRRHLERHTYISGSSQQAGYSERRGYYRRRGGDS